ncbi:MAG: hypothetical protein LBI17_01920, partial [Rickettsiales bacterium]|nr:hypothetical protein [Rickettsiales bacterium]
MRIDIGRSCGCLAINAGAASTQTAASAPVSTCETDADCPGQYCILVHDLSGDRKECSGIKCNANEGLEGDKCVPCKDGEEVKNGKCAKSRDSILGTKKDRSELLKGSTASTLNKVAAIGGAATGVTSTITSGVGAFATDFSSMK